MADIHSSTPVTLRTRKLTTNRLLGRRQFVLDIHHPSRPSVSRDDLTEQLAALHKVAPARVVVFGLKTRFGGGESTGYALIYDDEDAQRRNEPKYRLVRSEIMPKPRRVGHHLRKEDGEDGQSTTKKRRKENKEESSEEVLLERIQVQCVAPENKPNDIPLVQFQVAMPAYSTTGEKGRKLIMRSRQKRCYVLKGIPTVESLGHIASQGCSID